MRKIGLIIDSASGYSIKEANDRGHAFIPLQISINDEVKKAGVEIDHTELYASMEDKRKVQIKTSLPNGKDIEAAFDWALERYEKAIYVGISYKLSGTQNAVKNVLASDDKYKDRIFVYDSEYSSPWLNVYVEDFEWVLENYDDIEEIKEILDLANPYIYGTLAPGDIYWFYKGGRISKGAYMAGSLLKVVPVLTIDKGTLDKDNVVKARGFEKAMDKMNDMVEIRAKELQDKGIAFKYMCIDSNEKELTVKSLEKISERFHVDKNEIIAKEISLEQTAHMGPGSCGAGIWVSLQELVRHYKGE